MATARGVVDHIVEQAAAAGAVTARAMFGEYALYCDGRLVALVCDDRLFVKPTAPGRAHAGAAEEASPYPGAKPCLVIPGERWEDADWLATLVRLTAAALPPPVARRRGRPARTPRSMTP